MRKYIKKSQLQTVFIDNYNEDQKFWLGYQCKKCGLRFGDFSEFQQHVKSHRNIQSYQKKITGFCRICKKLTIIERHHFVYDGNQPNRENSITLCVLCHGKQQKVQKQIRKGVMMVYIGHILQHSKAQSH